MVQFIKFSSWLAIVVCVFCLSFVATTQAVVAQQAPEQSQPSNDDAEETAESTEQDDEPADELEFDFLQIGQAAPQLDGEFWLTDGNGLLPEVKKFKTGSVYVVQFFVTDNEYSVGLLPGLVKLQKKYAAKNLHVVAVGIEDQETMESFLDQDLPKLVTEDADFDSLETYFDLVNSISTVADPDQSIWEDYQSRSGRSAFSVFIVGKQGQVEWIGDPMDVAQPLDQVVAGTWDRKKFAKRFGREQEKIKQRSLATIRFARWQRAQLEGQENTSIEEIKQILADGFADPENESFKVLIQAARLQILMLAQDPELPEVMNSYTDLVDDPSQGGELNNIAWSVYEMYEAGEIEKNSELMQSAMYMAEKAVKLEPNSGAINDTVAHFIYLLDGDLDKAIVYQKKAIASARDTQTDALQSFLEFLQKEKKTGKRKSLQKDVEHEDESDF